MSGRAPRCPVRSIDILDQSDSDVRRRLEEHGLSLTPDEARRIATLLGRDPTVVEAHIFNTMWSEHCSYKSSRSILARFLPTDAANVVLGPGEDAGIVRLCRDGGRTWCAVMAHESHNHPSQIVPNEGAATGIGGIVRDVYCMGADVVGVLDPLRFGDPTGAHAARTREIIHGVVEGIWQYANALGVPNLGGDVCFDASFDENCLVNVVAIGIVEESEIVRSRAPSRAAREPYDVLLVGKPTDPSGFGGATFASRILDGGRTADDRYAVQVPDPFLKRMLTVATFEVLKAARARRLEVGFKDLGAGGIACATSEMGAAAGLGVRVDLSRVPAAEPDMPPEVLACSETQERYCLIVPRAFSAEVLAVYNQKFELPELCHGAGAAVIGEVTREARFVLAHRGSVVCDAPIGAITAGIAHEREPLERVRDRSGAQVPGTLDLGEALIAVLGSPNVASKEHVVSHYDSEVRGCTVVRPGEADAAVVTPVSGLGFGIAVSADGSPFLGAADPYTAGAAAVAEAVRNVAAVGAVPVAITDCLNFGSPEDPEVFHDFVEAVRGIGDAARGIGLKDSAEPIPVVSGNVSFYNQSSGGSAIPPSPVVCCLGFLDDAAACVTPGLKGEEHALYLLGERLGEIGQSALSRTVLDHAGADVPRVRFDEERGMAAAVTDCVAAGLVEACHDISEGGLAVALAEMALLAPRDSDLGLEVDLGAVGGAEVDAAQAARLLFCENGGYVLEISPAGEAGAAAVFARRNVRAFRLGTTARGGRMVIRGCGSAPLSFAVRDLREAWERGATEAMT